MIQKNRLLERQNRKHDKWWLTNRYLRESEKETVRRRTRKEGRTRPWKGGIVWRMRDGRGSEVAVEGKREEEEILEE